jgi:hypothetical protein
VSLALILVAACNRGHPFDPENPPEFSNDTNLFEWHAPAMVNVSETQNFTWQTTSDWVVVFAEPELVRGSALLRIWGASGTPVFSRNLEVRGGAATTIDTPGAWTIEIRLSGASGSLSFWVESPTLLPDSS